MNQPVCNSNPIAETSGAELLKSVDDLCKVVADCHKCLRDIEDALLGSPRPASPECASVPRSGILNYATDSVRADVSSLNDLRRDLERILAILVS